MRLIHQRTTGPVSGVQSSGSIVAVGASSLDFSAVLFPVANPLGYTNILGANQSEVSDFSTQFATSEFLPYPPGSPAPDNLANWVPTPLPSSYDPDSLLPLDLVPYAINAYSTRLVNSDYAGPLVELRRSSDQTLSDFYPDNTGVLSLTSENDSNETLSSWAGLDDISVHIWHDQTGNDYYAIAALAAYEPLIMSGGVLNTVNGMPYLYFNGTTHSLLSVRRIDLNWTFNIVLATTQNVALGGSAWYLLPGLLGGEMIGNTYDFGIGLNSAKLTYGSGVPENVSTANTANDDGLPSILSMTRNGTSGLISFYRNGLTDGTVTNNTGSRSVPITMCIGKMPAHGQGDNSYYQGYIAEMIQYTEIKDANRLADIQDNQIAKYS